MRAYRVLGIPARPRAVQTDDSSQTVSDTRDDRPSLPYNISSIEHLLPMAAYNLDSVALPITLRRALEGEPYRVIGSSEIDYLTGGEVVYADQEKIPCRDFNYRDGDATKVTDDTQSLVVFVDGCELVDKDDVARMLSEVANRIISFAGGRLESLEVYP